LKSSPIWPSRQSRVPPFQFASPLELGTQKIAGVGGSGSGFHRIFWRTETRNVLNNIKTQPRYISAEKQRYKAEN